jgi:hypothetical protein
VGRPSGVCTDGDEERRGGGVESSAPHAAYPHNTTSCVWPYMHDAPTYSRSIRCTATCALELGPLPQASSSSVCMSAPTLEVKGAGSSEVNGIFAPRDPTQVPIGFRRYMRAFVDACAGVLASWAGQTARPEACACMSVCVCLFRTCEEMRWPTESMWKRLSNQVRAGGGEQARRGTYVRACLTHNTRTWTHR